MNKLTGTLVYVQVQKPVDCFIKEKGQEYKASIVVDEDTADSWNEKFPKQSATVVKTSEFEDKFRIPAPFPEAKKQYVITLRKNTQYSKTEKDEDGNEVKKMYPLAEIHCPKVFLQTEEGRVDITKEKLVANGSKGIISVQIRELRVGDVANLGNILVTDLIEYKSEKKEAGSEFDDVVPVSKPAAKSESKPAAKTSGKKAPAVEAEDDSDPF